MNDARYFGVAVKFTPTLIEFFLGDHLVTNFRYISSVAEEVFMV